MLASLGIGSKHTTPHGSKGRVPLGSVRGLANSGGVRTMKNHPLLSLLLTAALFTATRFSGTKPWSHGVQHCSQAIALMSPTLSSSLAVCNGETSFKDHPASATVLLNFPTSLSCTANLPFPSSIAWQVNGVEVISDGATIVTSYDNITSGRSELRIASMEYKDAGNYTCLALDSRNALIISSQSAVITVLGILSCCIITVKY